MHSLVFVSLVTINTYLNNLIKNTSSKVDLYIFQMDDSQMKMFSEFKLFQYVKEIDYGCCKKI